ncbi:MAG: YbaK/EbsC family protein [Deltaproteobacteria bacterium]|nr:YbaK/EbsC family protein [Deltaproteobacteria bacterium]MBW2121629.1 YbaK/EbsC family protein [Deltaproteobacteria bacterium]
MSGKLSRKAQKVQDELRRLGFSHRVVESQRTTRSAADAAQAVGCTIGQIAKSLVFRSKSTDRPILVIASGPNRVSEEKIASYCSEPVEMASADFVRERTGFAIGGVPPVGHAEPMETYIDEDLLRHDEIWAAAGSPNAIFRLPPGDLIRMTGGRVVRVKGP